MGRERKIEITLDEWTVAAFEASVAEGRHPSLEAAVQAALDEWYADEFVRRVGPDRLAALIQEGIDSGPGRDAEEVFARLTAKYEAMAKARGA
jgi:antitoxin ParD1/3/4